MFLFKLLTTLLCVFFAVFIKQLFDNKNKVVADHNLNELSTKVFNILIYSSVTILILGLIYILHFLYFVL